MAGSQSAVNSVVLLDNGPWYSSYNLSVCTAGESSISVLDNSSRSSCRESPSVVGEKARSVASSRSLTSLVFTSSRAQFDVRGCGLSMVIVAVVAYCK